MRARLLLALLALALLACSAGDAPNAAAPAPTRETAASIATPRTSFPPFAAPTAPEAERALAHIRVLAGDIGPRSAGTEQERRAAEYLAGQLEQSGYDAVIEQFDVEVPRDESRIGLPSGITFMALALDGSANREVGARLVRGGLGRPEDLAGVDARGAVLLLERGITTFADKSRAAVAAGAVGVIIVNNQRGLFRGSLGAGFDIPIVAVNSSDAPSLEALVDGGEPVTLEAKRSTEPFKSQNVVGRPSDSPCTAYIGGHYDSVPLGPGANDNASGTSAVLELARTHRADGLCVIAFGAEEIGLWGSKAFVRDHDTSRVRFMLNFDMVAKISDPDFVYAPGDEAGRQLAERADEIARRQGINLGTGTFPSSSSSDHVSFSQAGVPALTLHSGDDVNIHTAADDTANVRLEDLRTMLEAGSAVLSALLAETGRS